MDFALMYETWKKVIIQPNEKTFQVALDHPQANTGSAVIGLAIAVVGFTLLNLIGTVINGFIQGTMLIPQLTQLQADLPPEFAAMISSFMAMGVGFLIGFSLVSTLIITPVFFFLWALIYYLAANLFEGNGSFDKHLYSLSILTAPLLLIKGLLFMIPLIGGYFGYIIYFYELLLTIFAMKTVHQLSTGQAIMVGLTPVLVTIVCIGFMICGFFISMFGLATFGGLSQ